jgi:hypothetical protein
MVIKNVKPKGWIWNPTKLVLDETTIYDTGKNGVNFKSPDGLFEIRDGVAYAYPGIEWDGTTIISDGGPDPDKPYYPITWKASLFHDLGCKYLNMLPEFKILYSRFDVDRWFYNILKTTKFKFTWMYYFGITLFSIFWNVKSFFLRKK